MEGLAGAIMASQMSLKDKGVRGGRVIGSGLGPRPASTGSEVGGLGMGSGLGMELIEWRGLLVAVVVEVAWLFLVVAVTLLSLLSLLSLVPLMAEEGLMISVDLVSGSCSVLVCLVEVGLVVGVLISRSFSLT